MLSRKLTSFIADLRIDWRNVISCDTEIADEYRPKKIMYADSPTNDGQNQTGPVWFLAGTGAGSAERTCTIPAGKAILFPVINSVSLRDAGQTKEELLDGNKEPLDKVTTVEASVDGIPLQNLSNYRIQSPFFNATLPKDNVLGIPEGTYLEVADGYWVFLEPLSPGQHEIRLRGAIIEPTSPTPSFERAVTYHLTISNSTIATTTPTNQTGAAHNATNAPTTTTTPTGAQ